MKKLILTSAILICIIAMSSCSYDDSNDIDIITPNDSLQAKANSTLIT